VDDGPAKLGLGAAVSNVKVETLEHAGTHTSVVLRNPNTKHVYSEYKIIAAKDSQAVRGCEGAVVVPPLGSVRLCTLGPDEQLKIEKLQTEEEAD